MAYQAGVSSSRQDLLDAVFTFATQFGFSVGPTEVRSASNIDNNNGGTRSYTIRSLQKGGVYFLFATDPDGTSFAGTTGYVYLNTATTWNGSTFSGSDLFWARADRLEGPHVGYHLFCDGNTFAVAVEVVTNVFCHLMFGEITKNGVWQGGQFVSAMSWGYPSSVSNISMASHNGTALSMHFGGLQNTWTSRNDSSSPGHVARNCGHIITPVHGPRAGFNTQRSGTASVLYETGSMGASATDILSFRQLILASPNSNNGRAVLVPVQFLQSSGVVSSAAAAVAPHFQLGYLANVAHINIRDLQPKQEVNGEWMVFPVCEKNGAGNPYVNSANFGYAFKK